MSTGISLVFAVGLLAVVTPCGLPLALAVVALRASAPDHGPGDFRPSLTIATASGAIAGGVFAATFLAAAVVEAIGVEVSDLIPVVALAFAVALVGLGVQTLAGARTGAARANLYVPAALFALAYAMASLPCALGLFQGLVEQTAKARGGGGVVAVAILFSAGAVTATIVLSLLGTLLATGVRVLGALGSAIAGALTVAAGSVAAVYWLPAVPGGVGDRGGVLSEALAETSGTIGVFIADYELGFALLLVGAASAALARSLGRFPDA